VSERRRDGARAGNGAAGAPSGASPRASPGGTRPAALGAAITDYLRQSGLAERVSQAGVIPEWPQLVGPQVAAVTQPLCVTADGTLFVAVATNPWMAELSLMERQLLAVINVVPGRAPVKKIRWQARG
jgi:predicted nucleic acid-binding Zn ribbon protein